MKLIKKKFYLFHAEMWSKSIKHKGMPYSALILKILKDFKVPLEGEEYVAFLQNWKVSTIALNIMKMVKTIEVSQIYGPHARTNGILLLMKKTLYLFLVQGLIVLEVTLLG